MKYLLFFTCFGLSFNLSSQETNEILISRDTIKNPKEIMEKIDSIFGSGDSAINPQIDTVFRTKSDVSVKGCSLVSSVLNASIYSTHSQYYFENENGVRYVLGNSNGMIESIGLNVEGYLISSNIVLSPWEVDSISKDEVKNFTPVLESVSYSQFSSKIGKEQCEFEELTKDLSVSKIKRKSYLKLGMNSKDDAEFIVISTGYVNKEFIIDEYTINSLSEFNIIQEKFSFDHYLGSYIIMPATKFGRIDFYLVALGIVVPKKNKDPKLLKIDNHIIDQLDRYKLGFEKKDLKGVTKKDKKKNRKN